MRRHLHQAIFGLVFLIAAACAVSTAETTPQKAYAIYGSFVAVEETALEIVRDPATPDGVVQIIASADLIAKPLADTMMIAARHYTEIEAEIAAIRAEGGTPSEEKLRLLGVALTELTEAIAEAEPSIAALISAVKSFKGDQ